GVDVADAGDEGLVEEEALDAGRAPADLGHEEVVVELGVEGIAGDVRDLGRQLGAALGDGQAAEHPLVHEAELAVTEVEPHPQVALVGVPGLLHEQLTTHPQVAEEGVAVVERQPEILAAPTGRLEAAPGQGSGEPGGAAVVTAYRTGMEHGDGPD